jgi:hypothetical protein
MERASRDSSAPRTLEERHAAQLPRQRHAEGLQELRRSTAPHGKPTRTGPKKSATRHNSRGHITANGSRKCRAARLPVARACGATTPASATPELPRQGTWNSPMRPKVLRGTALLGKPTHCGPQDERHAAQLPKGTRVERLPGEAPRAATLPGQGPRATAPAKVPCAVQLPDEGHARRLPGARPPAGLPGGAAQPSTRRPDTAALGYKPRAAAPGEATHGTAHWQRARRGQLTRGAASLQRLRQGQPPVGGVAAPAEHCIARAAQMDASPHNAPARSTCSRDANPAWRPSVIGGGLGPGGRST